jgi:hypothetical protein
MTPIQPSKTVTIQDPREFDGDPYQVAERAIQQLRGLILLAQELQESTDLMARSAELQRLLDLGNDLGDAGAKWPESPQGRQLLIIAKQLEDTEVRLGRLERAVAFNPKGR